MSNPYTSIINTKEDRSLPDLSSIPPALTDDDIIGFGQYSNIPLRDVPVRYFQWMVREMEDYPRVDRSLRWMQVIDWIKSKAL